MMVTSTQLTPGQTQARDQQFPPCGETSSSSAHTSNISKGRGKPKKMLPLLVHLQLFAQKSTYLRVQFLTIAFGGRPVTPPGVEAMAICLQSKNSHVQNGKLICVYDRECLYLRDCTMYIAAKLPSQIYDLC